MTALGAALYHPWMDAELTQLEQQLETLIGLYEGLRRENRELLRRVVKLDAENRRLGDKLKVAVEGVETILEKLPEA